uniref:Uncharacterized protein n=1 Tax=Batrachospermum sp. TaxID=31373 RepID=A0A8K1YV67_9FLOR|nr:hypothetical protein [Batrachospermum sp.]
MESCRRFCLSRNIIYIYNRMDWMGWQRILASYSKNQETHRKRNYNRCSTSIKILCIWFHMAISSAAGIYKW